MDTPSLIPPDKGLAAVWLFVPLALIQAFDNGGPRVQKDATAPHRLYGLAVMLEAAVDVSSSRCAWIVMGRDEELSQLHRAFERGWSVMNNSQPVHLR